MKKKNLIIGIILIIFVIVSVFILVKTNNKSDEGFTLQELSDMEYVDNAIKEITESDSYKNLNLQDRANKVKTILKKLKKDKYIKYYLYDEHNYLFSFEYKCGALGGVMLKEFDPMLN